MTRSQLARVGMPVLQAFLFVVAFAAPAGARASGGSGFVYTMSNAASGNSVIAYTRASDRTLAPNERTRPAAPGAASPGSARRTLSS